MYASGHQQQQQQQRRTIALRSDTKARQSMDRFGDDLCQHLLSYLSFEELFRYECVSKQWQRLIFAKQTELKIEYNWTSVFLPTRGGLVFARNESILRKCRFISHIYINKFVNNREEVFEVINKYCHNLSSIESDFDSLSEKTIDEFCRKFGTKLKKIRFHSNNDTNRRIFKRFANINVLNIKVFNDLSFLLNNVDNKVMATTTTTTAAAGHRLREISFTYTNDDIDRIGVFCDCNRQSLELLEVILSVTPLTRKAILNLFEGLAKLSELRTLVIGCHWEVDEYFEKCFNLIAKRCVKLKRLDLTISKSHCDPNGQLFGRLAGLRHLKRLSVKLHYHSDEQPMKLMAEAFRASKQLTHLRLISNLCLVTDDFFVQIDKYLPNLQVLELWSVDVTDQTFYSLAGLKQLRTVYLVCLKANSHINGSVIEELMNKNQKIKSIYFRNHSNCLDFKN